MKTKEQVIKQLSEALGMNWRARGEIISLENIVACLREANWKWSDTDLIIDLMLDQWMFKD